MGPLRLPTRRLGAQLAEAGAVLPSLFWSIECNNIEMKLLQEFVEGAVGGSLRSQTRKFPPVPSSNAGDLRCIMKWVLDDLYKYLDTY